MSDITLPLFYSTLPVLYSTLLYPTSFDSTPITLFQNLFHPSFPLPSSPHQEYNPLMYSTLLMSSTHDIYLICP